MLDDPATRSAYILTKLAVLAVVAGATWPLARIFGARAWWGLAAFAVLLLTVTVVVLAAAGRGGRQRPDDGDEDAADPPVDPDAPVELPVEDALDLHPFAPRDIPAVVVDYLEAAAAADFREVRIIHGRGTGFQRERVREVLSGHQLVESYHDAPPSRGGWGATIARLRSRTEESELPQG